MADPVPHPPQPHVVLERPSFFRILVGHLWGQLLRMPPLFVSLYSADLSTAPNLAFLRTHYGNWIIRMDYTDDATCTFTDGWNEFVVGNNFSHGELLLFNALDSSHFTVVAYNRHGCATILPASLQVHPQHQPELFSVVEFITLRNYNMYNMNIRLSFMRRSGLSEQREVRVFNSDGLSWLIGIRDGRRLGPGWARFWHDNNLAVGHTYKLRCLVDIDGNLVRCEFIRA